MRRGGGCSAERCIDRPYRGLLKKDAGWDGRRRYLIGQVNWNLMQPLVIVWVYFRYAGKCAAEWGYGGEQRTCADQKQVIRLHRKTSFIV